LRIRIPNVTEKQQNRSQNRRSVTLASLAADAGLYIFIDAMIIPKIKIILAIILPIFLFLPLGSCERKPVGVYSEASKLPVQEKESIDRNLEGKEKPDKDYLVLIKDVSKSAPSSWLSIFPFLWPIPFLFIKKIVSKSKWKFIIANIIELLFTGFSVYFIYFLVFFFWYDPTIWGYLAALVISFYSIAFLAEVIQAYLKPKFHKI
jgi:hypothetical protein